jgi:S-adenosylhomocysteine hydrolase
LRQGRKELAEAEMPGLMALREEYKTATVKGQNCWLFTHDYQNTVLETLIALVLRLLSSCNISLHKIKLLQLLLQNSGLRLERFKQGC